MKPALLALICAVSMLGGACSAKAAPLPGTDLGRQPAADFNLTDQDGRAVSLAAQRGRPVVLTFLYTECPDVCPVIASRLSQALEQLGPDAAKVSVIALSVDPERDTPAAARAFMAMHGLSGPGRHYLLGDTATLAPAWLAYGVGASALLPGSTASAPGPRQVGRIGHTDATYLIDREGNKRTLLRGDATAAEIARGLRALLR